MNTCFCQGDAKQTTSYLYLVTCLLQLQYYHGQPRNLILHRLSSASNSALLEVKGLWRDGRCVVPIIKGELILMVKNRSICFRDCSIEIQDDGGRLLGCVDKLL